MLVLGLETSCDETAAAVVEDGRRALSSVVSSQADLHARYGGVVPEIASRRHIEQVVPVVHEALGRAGVGLGDIDAVAVTRGPGLINALMVGLSAAKALAYVLRVPLAGTNHLVAHVYANFLEIEPDVWPAVALVASGGHSDLFLLEGHGRIEVLGRTRDDAAGEAFDKSARAMGLGYPGGPAVDALARRGDPAAVRLPRAYLEEGSLDFSFSGLKTAVMVYLERAAEEGREVNRADLAAGLEAAVAEVLATKTFRAARAAGVRRVLLAGGVAANTGLRAECARLAAEAGIELHVPSPALCTDNAAMVASAGYYLLREGLATGLDVGASADLVPGGGEGGAGRAAG